MKYTFFLMPLLMMFVAVASMPEARARDYRNETESERKHRLEDERRKRAADESRRRAKAEQRAREAEQVKKAKESSKRLAAKESEVNDARMARITQELKAEQSAKVDYVHRPRGLKESTFTWTGKLVKETVKVGGKQEVRYLLTTADGKRVVFMKKAIVEHSLTGMDLSLCIGKDVTVKGSASARKVGDKLIHYVVSKINTSTLKSSAIYDDLAE